MICPYQTCNFLSHPHPKRENQHESQKIKSNVPDLFEEILACMGLANQKLCYCYVRKILEKRMFMKILMNMETGGEA